MWDLEGSNGTMVFVLEVQIRHMFILEWKERFIYTEKAGPRARTYFHLLGG